MECVVNEILQEVKDRCDIGTYNYLNSFITIKLNGYKILKEETGISVYEPDKNEQVFKMFMVSKKLQGLTDRSLKAYKGEIKRALASINKQYDEITSNDIKYYLACMQLKGTCNSKTIDNSRRFLSAFFQWLEDEEYINKNPIKKIKKIRQKEEIKKAFKYDEIERLKLVCAEKFEIALVETLLSTGVRANELVNIKLSDVNFNENEIKVLGKGNKERIVYLNSSSKIRLLDYLNNKKVQSDYLFSKSRSPFDGFGGDHIRKTIKLIGIKSGVADTHPHRFRRTSATIAHKRGMQIEEIQKMLGHSSLATTQIYVAVDDCDVKKSHEKYMN